MRLLDTHVMIWYALGDDQLSKTAESLLVDADNVVLISPASYWEIAIKVSIGKLKLHARYEDFIDLCLNQYGFQILPIEPAHTARLVALPFRSNHKDPFDRLLVAQSILEGIPIVSSDLVLDAYPVERLW